MSKKILVWIDSNFMLFCLSYFLQEKSDYEFYAIIDITNKTKDFFEKQNLVNFKKVWYYFDHIQPNKNPDIDYLSNFEKKYYEIPNFYAFYKFPGKIREYNFIHSLTKNKY